MDRHNTWLYQGGIRQVELYTSTADAILPERHRIIQLLSDIAGYHLGERTELAFLDLGCGDGVVTEQMHARFPQSAFTLLDGSTMMLDKARQRLGEEGSFCFLCQTFEAYVDADVQDARYDCCFSVNAIHHLDWMGKTRLYAKLYRELVHGGLLLVSDPVLPSSERSEAWQFAIWRDWMARNLVASGHADEAAKYDGLPQKYKHEPENKPSGLFDQMRLLERIGFRNVDCFWKLGIFAVFGGTK
jgi:tRNA (cmo5U34)-methyltransferase